MKKYDIIEHTADIGIKAYGKNLSECFENAAVGMFDIISDTKKVKPVGEYEISLKSDTVEELLVDWLSKLLTVSDINNILFGKFDVSVDEEKCELNANVYGENFDSEQHTVGKEIKAVTYHILEVNKEKGYVQVLFDI
ncbi:MAG: archease [Euryarchaeota archaeon CG01_land_8_20_14_3_00_38_12]|nr:MAG: archease [Euryarchaeota archaeon CG01_land_8_20_14_3_00_38_12]PJB21903.1 MAG: archease [Euryarchaeota archaeon CG_4_9_14_3_um_filter_38_12]